MSLRNKTLFIISMSVLAMMAIIYGISRVILLGGFVKLEEELARQNINRAYSTLSNELSRLEDTASDWAAWDETYNFVDNPNNDEYAKENLTNSTFSTIKISLLLITNTAGQILLSKGFDLNNEEEIPLPPSFVDYLSVNRLLLYHPHLESSEKGIILLPENPMLIASKPILTSENKGPIRGSFIMGRYLDASLIKKLADSTHLSLSIHRFNNFLMPSDFLTARSFFSPDESIFVQPLSEYSIAGYYQLKDIYGNPALILRTDMPREVYKKGQAIMLYFILLLPAIWLVFGAVALLLLERTVLSRLTHLRKNIINIGASRDLSAHISIKGKDELSSLTDKINEMLVALKKSEEALQESEERYKFLIDNTREIILILSKKGKILFVSKRALATFGYSEKEIIGEPINRFLTDDCIEKAWHTLNQEFLGNPQPEMEFQVKTKSGEIRCLEFAQGSTPVHKKGKLIGVMLNARDITQRKKIERENIMLAEELMEKNRQLEQANEELTELSITDGLTKIYNHRFFQEALLLEFHRSKRSNQILSLAMFDIDNFKKINDIYGHRAGDFVLTELVFLIKRNIRESDLFARYGGEEFVILLSDTSLKSAVKIAEKLRTLIESYDFNWQEMVLNITMSVGVASTESEGIDLKESLLEMADRNLLIAKKQGKNCIYA